MLSNYRNTGRDFGYGHAKQLLFELIVTKFKVEREKYNYYMEHQSEIDKALLHGAEKATVIAKGVLSRVREKLGYLPM